MDRNPSTRGNTSSEDRGKQVGRGKVSKPKRGVPPFDHSTTLRIFIDPDLLRYDEVWAAAGTWNDNFAIEPNELVRVSGGVVTELKR